MVLRSCLRFPCWAARWRHFCFVSCSPCVNCMIVSNCLIIVFWLSRFPFPFRGLIVHGALLCLVSVFYLSCPLP
uniref:Uncharacterized protein n=1 Tax=Anguilla anguilla TaxID=7936 RepID=A0A0E9XDQ7_ANGAN